MMQPPEPAASTGLRVRLGEAALSAWCLATALLFALTTLVAIVNFGWRQPMFDQWREAETFIGLPFPANVLQIANGHRPVIPNLIRVAEIRWLADDQLLQITIGTLAAFACAGLLAATAWRERSLGPARRAFGVLVAVLGILWLGNARRLLHGNESLHGYLPTVFALGAVLLVQRVRAGRPFTAIAGATALSVLATFSFGLGLASFCAVIALLVVMRRPWSESIMPALTLLICFVLYTYLMPGSAAVRTSVGVAPVQIGAILAQWLASPWHNAWLDLATTGEPMEPWVQWPFRALSDSARFVESRIGIGPDTVCLLAGIAGVALFAASTWNVYRRRGQASTLELLAVGAGTYAFVSGALTVVGRLSYLQQLPGQIYADRYLLWPSLFWSSIALLLIAQLPPLRSAFARGAAAAVMLALPIVFVVTQNNGAIWSAIVYRGAQKNAAFLRSGVFDRASFSGEDIPLEDQLREVALLREHRLAMFADAAWQRVGTSWTGTLSADRDVTIQVRWIDLVADPSAATPAGHLEGVVLQGLRQLRHRQLAILTTDHRIAGLAEYSFISPVSAALQLRFPPKRGFDGYVHDFDPTRDYLLAALDLDANSGIVLAKIAPLIAPPRARADAVAAASPR